MYYKFFVTILRVFIFQIIVKLKEGGSMLSFEKNLDKEICRLEEVLGKVLEVEIDLPEGSLNVNGNKAYWYKNGERTYIPKKYNELAYKLCLNSYIPKLKENVLKRLKILKEYKDFTENNPLVNIENDFNKNKKYYLKPLYKSYKDFSSEWLNENYDRKKLEITPNTLTTNRGDVVRSKSECLIANFLYQRKIAYRYEAAIGLEDVDGFGNKFSRKIYPDFMILHPKTREIIIWEHFGMMDNSDYSRSALLKINNYINNGYIPGINLICTFESLDVNWNGVAINKLIDSLFV